MSVISGANIIRDNLVLQFDIANTKSFRGDATVNIAPYTDYSNRNYNTLYVATSWGGDAANVYYYPNGGYNNLPYKKLIKISGGTGGSYLSDNQYFTIKDNTVYAISCYMKSNKVASYLNYIYCINRSSDNTYRLAPSDITITNEWKRYSWIYSAGTNHSGNTYMSVHIDYIDANLPIEISWCGFQVEEKNYVTPYVNGTRGLTPSTGGGVLDLSNNKLHGSITATGVLYSSLKGGALLFNGSSGYVDFGNSSLIKIQQDLHISCWINVSEFRDSAAIFKQFGSGVGGGYGGYRFLTTASSGLSFGGGMNISGAYEVIVINNVLRLNTWHYVTVSKKLNNVKIYVDAVLVKDANFTETTFRLPVGLNAYAGFNDWNGIYYKGYIAVLMLNSKPYTQDEISQNFNSMKLRFKS